MNRCFIAVPIGCLYVAVASWIVHAQGVAYRNSLLRQAVAARTVPDRPSGPLAEDRGPSAEPTPSPRTPSEPTGAPPEPPSVPVAPLPVSPQTTVSVGPVPSVTTPVPLLTPDAAAPPPAGPPASLNAGAAWANSLDLSNLNPEDEQRLGTELNKLVVSMVPPLEEGTWLRWTTRVARGLSDTNYTITVLDSDAVEAFSHPGGFIYVCRGLFDLIGSDEDYALEFVLGHEMAHLDRKDALKIVAQGNAEAKRRGVDTIHQFLVPLTLAYPDEWEFQADAWSVKQMITRHNRSRRETLAFLRKLQGYAESHEFGNGHKQPGPDVPPLENHFRAHPATWDRLDRLEGLTSPVPGTSR